MKGCLVVLGVFLGVAAAAVAVMLFVIRSGGPSTEESLTQRVQAQVTASEPDYDARASPSRGYAVDLRYRVDGTWYAVAGWVPEARWTPDQGAVAVCVDPDEPASVVVPTREGATCGESSVGRNEPQTAKLSTAP